ncbi:hypothetical protein MA16_Dca025939 [Dendrobium catenatum]|uniref:Uncharacterized protein n=1 Tax=Dendrobium catenatum TaxID=906689 RepID=A0A2I0WXT0_9ASPA|nr:hypothetical protein MA16_Dca025939 [Dendrobium catenatum]
MVGGKCSRQVSRSSSRATLDPRFMEADDQIAYHRYKLVSITMSWSINPNHLSYPVTYAYKAINLAPKKVEKPLQYSLSPTQRGGVPSAILTLLVTAENLQVFLPPGEGRVPSRSTDVDESPP